jgi:acyl carrier protein
MQRHEIEERVLDVLSAALKCPISTMSRRADVPAWDSLKHIEVVFAIEDELELQFTEDELGQLDSVAAIVELAAHKACSMAM